MVGAGAEGRRGAWLYWFEPFSAVPIPPLTTLSNPITPHRSAGQIIDLFPVK